LIGTESQTAAPATRGDAVIVIRVIRTDRSSHGNIQTARFRPREAPAGRQGGR